MDQLNELGFYVLAGAPQSPAELIDEVAVGEALGLGSTFISERFNIKEAATLSGAAGAVTEEIGIATGATNHNTRHPIVTASFATTMHRLTGGRFALGLSRGIKPQFDAFGLPAITTAQLEDMAGVLREVAGMGYQGVELAGTGNLTVPEVKEHLDELNLRAVGSHTALDALQGQVRKKRRRHEHQRHDGSGADR